MFNVTEKIKYEPNHLGSFEKEWGVHKNCREWWYATGVMFDNEKNLYSYQYTLLHLTFGIISMKVAMIALTDFKNNRHYYLQCPSSRKEPVRISNKEASMGDIASAAKHEDGILLSLNHRDFSIEFFANYGKGAFWHCDNGKLQMGIPGEKETTLYYSYTNMPTEGTLTLQGKMIHLRGKTWFDKQGGSYSIFNAKTHWEWFSLRFFDEEEMMLFTFPQDHYYDGTYIKADGTSARLNDYSIKAVKTIKAMNMTWSAGWELHLAHKEKDYTIEPIQDGHMNFAYFEELCHIKNMKGEVVGYCFVELLPGVRAQEGKGISVANLFKRIEY
ncbi:MAG: lipocalin-like domain-containing protein [Candidatus Limiplasma sp.]|nr:lipocalin-like domain-containing protein [Candidatus Limiplasma sp.]